MLALAEWFEPKFDEHHFLADEDWPEIMEEEDIWRTIVMMKEKRNEYFKTKQFHMAVSKYNI